MIASLKNKKGKGSLGLLIGLMLIAAGGYVGLKLGEPYLAYMDLKKTMDYWADHDISQGDMKYTNLLKNVQETINEHGIPLNATDLIINYDKQKTLLTVSAEYDVYVELPGYEHHYHFSPKVKIQK